MTLTVSAAVLAALSLLLLFREGVRGHRLLLCVFPVVLAFLLRLLCMDHVTYDYVDFLSRWWASFRELGGFSAIRLNVGNYNVPYLYFLAAISYLSANPLHLIKLFSICFDVVLAWGGLRLARVYCPPESPRPAAAFCLLLLLPTVVLNGACWGQCDSIYAAFCIHALACALDRKPGASVILLAAAFAFKLQAVFLLPLWCVFWFTGRIRARHIPLFPLTYFLFLLPALLLGKPLGDTLAIYFGQAGAYSDYLTLNAPSVYALIPYGAQVDTGGAARLGILAAFVLVAVLLLLLFRYRRRVDREVLFTAAALLAVGVPWLLPNMHDRYFFLADVLTLVWACLFLRRVPLAALVQFASLSAYATYLRLEYTVLLHLGPCYFPLGLESLCLMAALISLWVILLRQLRARRDGPLPA